MQPDLAAKEAAWTVALSPGEPARIAQACAAGIWMPGQEELMAGYCDRYFTEANVLRLAVAEQATIMHRRLAAHQRH